MSTSLWYFCTSAIPSGAATKLTSFMFFAPFSFNTSIAAIAEPPVASIGSTIIISLSSISCGNLQ